MNNSFIHLEYFLTIIRLYIYIDRFNDIYINGFFFFLKNKQTNTIHTIHTYSKFLIDIKLKHAIEYSNN